MLADLQPSQSDSSEGNSKEFEDSEKEEEPPKIHSQDTDYNLPKYVAPKKPLKYDEKTLAIEKIEHLFLSESGNQVKEISQYTLHEHLKNFGIIISKACEKENLSAMFTLSRDWADRVNKNYERINYRALKQL